MKNSKYYKKIMSKQNNNNYNWLTKLLLTIIIILISLICCNFNSNFRESFKRSVLEENMNFSTFNKYYKKIMSNDKSTIEVNNEIDKPIDWEPYNNSYKVNYGIDAPVYVITPGIIVYNGNKDDLDNTVIVQGNDGVDIWYSGINLSEYSLYDYVSEGNILGNSLEEEVIITIVEDGKKIKYEEYFE